MNGRLLVVDDDPNLLDFVRVALRDSGLEVETAGSGEEGIRLAMEKPPDAVVLDVVLPGMDGLETFHLLRERMDQEIPVVLITSYASMDLTVEAMKEGAREFLTKPIRAPELTRLVEEILGPVPGPDEPVAGDGPDRPDAGLDVEGGWGDSPLVGRSPQMVEVFKKIGRVGPADSSVLLVGESGTGKELVAHALHRHSGRDGSFLAVNCAAIPETLLESELFGHERGAFTGADRLRRGKFERASGGTLFLDEISEMPLVLQPKILRALEEGRVERLGGSESVPADVRVVAASSRPPTDLVERGKFREDLYYRLAVVTIDLPPLREREGDLRRLVDHFVSRLGPRVDRPIRRIDPAVYELLAQYHWPGNVRELRNVVERTLVLGHGPVLAAGELPDLPDSLPGGSASRGLRDLARAKCSLEEVERRYLTRVLEEAGWNQSEAARWLGIHRNTVRRKIDEYDLGPPGDAG